MEGEIMIIDKVKFIEGVDAAAQDAGMYVYDVFVNGKELFCNDIPEDIDVDNVEIREHVFTPYIPCIELPKIPVDLKYFC
jgi:hypothetical protein